jgi:hypothetical protein
MIPEDERGPDQNSPLRKIKFRGRLIGFGIGGVLIGLLGLFLVTGLAGSPWLFLLYPLLIGLTFVSLLVVALQLLHRL